MVAAIVSEFVATRRVPIDPATRRWRRLGLGGALILHATLGAVLLTLRPWATEPQQETVYDLVFVPPAAAPAAAAIEPEPALDPATPASPPEPEALPDREPPPAVTTVPEPPKPATRPRPQHVPRPHVQPAPRSVVEAPADSPPDSQANPAALAAVPVAPPAPAVHAPPDAAYANTLLTWLDRHKEYPWTARRRGMQGRVVLHLAVARSGTVTEAHIESSSGTEILDEAAIEMVQRANPVPPLPSSFPGDRAEFRVPVEFALSR